MRLSQSASRVPGKDVTCCPWTPQARVCQYCYRQSTPAYCIWAAFVLQMLFWIHYQEMALFWLFSSSWDTSCSPSWPWIESYVESFGTMNSHSTNSSCQVFCNLCPLRAKWHQELLFFWGEVSSVRQTLLYVNGVFANFPYLRLYLIFNNGH